MFYNMYLLAINTLLINKKNKKKINFVCIYKFWAVIDFPKPQIVVERQVCTKSTNPERQIDIRFYT